MALSDSDGTTDLYIGEKSGFHSLISSSANPEQKKITINQSRLDAVLKENGISSVNLIKIDVEGAELQVLKGAINTIKQNHNLKIILDLHPQKGVNIHEVCNFLLGYGYKLYSIGRETTPVQSINQSINELFATKEE